MLDSNAERLLASIRERNGRFGVSLVALTLAVFTVGFAGGSVLAGEAVESQAWVVPVLGACLATMAALYAEG